MSHKPHPLAEEFPLLEGAELKEFTDGVKDNGLIHPIVLYENMILDGRDRETACEIAGVEPRYVTLEEVRQGKDLDPVGYVIAANLHRRHLEAGARAMIAARLATATVGGDHSTNSLNGVPVSHVAKQMNVGTTSVTIARAIQNADPKVAAEVKAGKISLNEGAERAGVARKAKPAKKDFQPERPDSPEVPNTKAKRAHTSGAEAKEVPVVDGATSKEQKLKESFWNWVESHDPDNRLAIKVALQQSIAQMDLGESASADALKQIVRVMDLQDLKEIVAIKELEEADARADIGVPSPSGPETTSSEPQLADNVVEFPAVSVDTPVTTPKSPRKKPALTKEAQITAQLKKELDTLIAAGTLTQESQTERDNLVNQIRTIELNGFESWKKTYGTPAPAVSDRPVENHNPVEADQSVTIPTAKMEIPAGQETVPEQPVTAPTLKTQTVREQTREKLERAFGKSGNPHSHNVDDILNALEKKGWDIRHRQEQTLANTVAKCENIGALIKVFANNVKKVTW